MSPKWQSAALRRKLIFNSAHELPPTLSAFAGLGNAPFLLSCFMALDKLHVVDLGVTRLFCYLVCTVITAHTTQPLSRTIAISDRYLSLRASARLTSHVPFWATPKDSQADISGKIRRQTAPLLWCSHMCVTNYSPDNDPVLQTALELDAINDFLCTSANLKYSEIMKWQHYFFCFLLIYGHNFQHRRNN